MTSINTLRVLGSAVLSLFLASVITACGGSGGSDDFAGDSSDTGTASFAATDAPVDDVTTVKVTFDRIDLQPSSGERISIELDPAVTIDNLLALQGDASEPILADTTVPAGQYDFLRLFVIGGSPDSEVVEEGGGMFDLFIPGQQPQSQNPNRRFLQLVTPFIIPAGGDADFTIDFDLRKALTKPAMQNHYLLRPALRLVNNVEVGTITGTVGAQLTQDQSCSGESSMEGNVVYLYEGSDAVIGDVNVDENGDGDHATDDTDGDTAEVNPLTTATVTMNNSTGEFEYTIGFVADGDYTIAFTCQAVNDAPDTDEAIEFVQPQNVTVTANQTSTVNFTAMP